MKLNPQTVHIEMLKTLTPRLRYAPGEDFAAWQSAARARLNELLGLPLPACEPDLRIEWQQDMGDYTETRFLFASEPGVDVLCHLLLPKTDKKVPLVICLQGHSKGMHISLGRPKFPGDEETISGGDRDFARQIIARGQAALTVEQRCFGERGGTPDGPACYQTAMQALLLGRTLIGERCWDISRAIDVIEAHFPMIDPAEIAVMGNSGGGTTSVYAAALDERIAAAMPSCAFCGYLPSIGAQYHCSCNYVPGIARDFDMGDLAGLIAPRPMVIVNGEKDEIFPIDSAKEQFVIAQMLYAAAGAPDSLRHIIGGEGHRFYAAIGWPAFDEVTGRKGV